MGKGIENWTDVDYAQAAIDMLPGTVEEIREMLANQGITRSKRGVPIIKGCPVGQWVNRWTDHPAAVNHFTAHPFYLGGGLGGGWSVSLPDPVQEFILEFDRLRR